MTKLKVQIIGSGAAASKQHAAFEQLSGIYEITNDDPDVVSICSPPFDHFASAGVAMEAGRHVIVEKPHFSDLYQHDYLTLYQDETKRKIYPIFQYRFANHGHVSTLMQSYWHREENYWAGWRGDWQLASGGCLMSHGCHCLDLMLQKYGMPDLVFARMDFGPQVEMSCDLRMRWPAIKMMGRLIVSLSPALPTSGFTLGNSHAGYVGQFLLIHEAITLDKPSPVRLTEARQVLEVMTAAYYSVHTGKVVMLPLSGRHEFYRGWQQPFLQQQPQSRSSLRRSSKPDHLAHQPK